MELVSWDDDIPIYYGEKKYVPNHQPDRKSMAIPGTQIGGTYHMFWAYLSGLFFRGYTLKIWPKIWKILWMVAYHPIILLGFQPSGWWCRISQPPTVSFE